MSFYVDPKDALEGEIRRMRRDLARVHPGLPIPSPDAPVDVTAEDAAEWANPGAVEWALPHEIAEDSTDA